MSVVTKAVGGVLNCFLRPMGYEVVPIWTRELSISRTTFTFNGTNYPYTAHHYNCGWPPGPMTERTVELSLADRWLNVAGEDRVVEIGAVTPYYWPNRLRRVVDPYDPHPRVTQRQSITDIDLSRNLMLSISTFEHFGLTDYGQTADPDLMKRTLEKVFAESPGFLVTVGVGYNPKLDCFLFDGKLPRDVNIGYLVRTNSLWGWRQECSPQLARLPYGDQAANSVVILERGRVLFPVADADNSRSP